eukprot:gene11469-14004_t
MPFYPGPAASLKYKDKACGGIRAILTNRDTCPVVDIGIQLALTIRQLYPDNFKVEEMARLLGDDATLNAIKAGESLAQIKARWSASLAKYEERRKGRRSPAGRSPRRRRSEGGPLAAIVSAHPATPTPLPTPRPPALRRSGESRTFPPRPTASEKSAKISGSPPSPYSRFSPAAPHHSHLGLNPCSSVKSVVKNFRFSD